MFDNEPSRVSTHCIWRKDAVFLEQITWDQVFARYGVANGVLFTLKHIYQRWLYPAILVGGLTFAFVAGPLGSLPLAMAFHWIGNFLIQMVFLFQAVVASSL